MVIFYLYATRNQVDTAFADAVLFGCEDGFGAFFSGKNYLYYRNPTNGRFPADVVICASFNSLQGGLEVVLRRKTTKVCSKPEADDPKCAPPDRPWLRVGAVWLLSSE